MTGTRESLDGLDLAVGRLPIEDEARAVMTSAPFYIDGVIQFLTAGNFTLSGVRVDDSGNTRQRLAATPLANRLRQDLAEKANRTNMSDWCRIPHRLNRSLKAKLLAMNRAKGDGGLLLITSFI